MPENLNYAERWEPELLEIHQQESLISPFMTTNVRWLDAKTFHFTQMSVGGFKNHSRSGGWNSGTYTQTDVPFTLKHDRDIQFLVDKADVDETNSTASIQNISKTFVRTQSVPESSALFFSRCSGVAKTASLYSETSLETYTKKNVYSKLKSAISQGKLKIYRAKGALIMYVRSEIMDLLEEAEDFTRKIEMTQIAEGGIGIETRITSINGVTLMEVIDDEVFYSEFDFDGESGGFTSAESAQKINFMIVSPLTTKFVPKISSIYYFNPGAHTEGDGYLYQHRELSDVFTFPNGKDGKIDSIFADFQPVAG